MTRRTLTNLVVTGALAALCFVCTLSKSAAEPIAGDASNAAPENIASQSPEVTDAMARFKEGKFDEAVKLLQEATKKDSDMPPAQVIMAQWFAQVNIPARMRDAFEQAVMEDPADPEAYVIMGDLALRERRVAEAEMLYQKSAELVAKFDKSPKRKDLLQPRIFSGLTTVAEARRNWAGAQKQLDAWLKVDPKSASAMQRLAWSLFQQKDPSGALDKLKEAAKVDAEILTPQARLAEFYEKSGDHDNAKKWMAEAVKVAPKDLKTRLTAANWALETGQLEQAETEATAAMQIDPKSLDAKNLSGVIALFRKDYPAAERFFEAAHVQSPRSFAASNNLALALIEEKDEAKKRRALEYAANNAQQYPKNAEANSTYGWVLYKLGRLDEAQKAFEAVVNSGGAMSPDTAYYIARFSIDRGRSDQARQWLENALKSTGPFAARQEAEDLLKELKK
jgi:cellulose synthase operon protein C